MCNCVVTAALSQGMSWQPSQAPRCQRSHGRGLQRQLCLGKVPSNSVFRLKEQNISLFFQKPPKRVGWLAAEMLEQRRISASVQVWSEGPREALVLRTDLMCGGGAGSGKAPLCRGPFCHCKALPCLVQLSFLPWGPAGNEATLRSDAKTNRDLLGWVQHSSEHSEMELTLSSQSQEPSSHNKLSNSCYVLEMLCYVANTHKRVMRDINDRKLLNCGFFFFFVLV